MRVGIIIYLAGLILQPEPVEEVKTLYDQGSYEEAVQAAEGILEETPGLELEAVVGLRKLVAFSWVALGRREEAKEEFKAILEIDPALTLDPLLISPKIIQVFEEARGELLSLRTALSRSLIFPGMGQLYSGERRKGRIFILGEGLTLCGLLISHIFTEKAHKAYHDAQDPSEIETRYQSYNNWFRIRTGFGCLSVGIWVCAPLDILLFPPPWAAGR